MTVRVTAETELADVVTAADVVVRLTGGLLSRADADFGRLGAAVVTVLGDGDADDVFTVVDVCGGDGVTAADGPTAAAPHHHGRRQTGGSTGTHRCPHP